MFSPLWHHTNASRTLFTQAGGHLSDASQQVPTLDDVGFQQCHRETMTQLFGKMYSQYSITKFADNKYLEK